jgi:hypothetical protein
MRYLVLSLITSLCNGVPVPYNLGWWGDSGDKSVKSKKNEAGSLPPNHSIGYRYVCKFMFFAECLKKGPKNLIDMKDLNLDSQLEKILDPDPH